MRTKRNPETFINAKAKENLLEARPSITGMMIIDGRSYPTPVVLAWLCEEVKRMQDAMRKLGACRCSICRNFFHEDEELINLMGETVCDDCIGEWVWLHEDDTTPGNETYSGVIDQLVQHIYREGWDKLSSKGKANATYTDIVTGIPIIPKLCNALKDREIPRNVRWASLFPNGVIEAVKGWGIELDAYTK